MPDQDDDSDAMSARAAAPWPRARPTGAPARPTRITHRSIAPGAHAPPGARQIAPRRVRTRRGAGPDTGWGPLIGVVGIVLMAGWAALTLVGMPTLGVAWRTGGADGALPTSSDAPGAPAVLTGAVLLYESPYRGDCPALGAIEAGRAFRLVEHRGAWTLIDAAGSGRVWVRHPAVRGGARPDGRLPEPVIAYRVPGDDAITPRECATLIGLATRGDRYREIARAGTWRLIRVNGVDAWTDAIPDE